MATDSTFAWALKAPCIPDVAAVAVVPAQDAAELT
jgi:hypothetical protein